MCVFFYIDTCTNGLSVDISPIPATAIAGDNLIVTSVITKTETESWKAFVFYVFDSGNTQACGGAPYTAPAACSDIFGCSYGFSFSCNYTHFSLLLNNVTILFKGFSIYAEVTIAGSPTVKSVTTTIIVKSEYHYKLIIRYYKIALL